MYAIIKAGGKQYTVKPGDVVRVEKMDAELGTELKLDVLMVGGDKTFVGAGANKATVTVVVTNQERGPKMIIFKKKRRQGYRRTNGHRQPYTEIFVTSITNPDGQTEKSDKKPNVFNPEKKAQALAKTAEVREMHKESARKAGGASTTEATSAPVKKSAKKAAGAGEKTAGAKKKTAPKKAGAKKTAAKKTTKK
jgi:large subunit ribosomal protein L21